MHKQNAMPKKSGAKYIVTDSKGKELGYVECFSAPAFTGRKTNYTARRLNGDVIGMAQPTLRAAELLLRALA